MLEITDLAKRYGSVVALDGATFTRPARPARRLPRAERRRQDDDDALHLRPRPAGPRDDHLERRGRSTGRPGCAFGYMPEQRGLYPRMKVADQLSYFAQHHGLSGARRERGDGALARAASGSPTGPRSKLEALSHGNQQRVQLGAALVHDPELLVLDEPFSGLDPIGIATMSEILRERAAAGVGVVFSSHQLDLVEDICEDVVIIDRGRIAAPGAIDELRAASDRRHLEVEVEGNGSALARRPAGPHRRRAAAATSSGSSSAADVDLAGAPRRGVGRRSGPALLVPAADPVGALHGGRPVMSRRRAIWLVARREILERGRSRAFLALARPVRRDHPRRDLPAGAHRRAGAGVAAPRDRRDAAGERSTTSLAAAGAQAAA